MLHENSSEFNKIKGTYIINGKQNSNKMLLITLPFGLHKRNKYPKRRNDMQFKYCCGGFFTLFLQFPSNGCARLHFDVAIVYFLFSEELIAFQSRNSMYEFKRNTTFAMIILVQ